MPPPPPPTQIQSPSSLPAGMWAALTVLVAGLASAFGQPSSPAPITVFYETLCPDSIRFINSKLAPAYMQENFNFASLMSNLTLVPYGKVKVNNAARYDFVCQHGWSECEGNKLHGCAIRYFPDQRQLIQYISCLLNKSDFKRNSYVPYPINECQNLIPLEVFPKISNCYNTNEGWDLFIQNGIITDSFLGPIKYFIPYISFDNIKDDRTSDNANNDFRNTLCAKNHLSDYFCTDYK